MRSQKSRTTEQIARNQRVTLLELLDRLLDRGVMVKGEILLSVADIDLVYLNLGLLLSSVKTVESATRRSDRRDREVIARQTSSQGEFLDAPQLEEGNKEKVSMPLSKENGHSRNNDNKASNTTLPSAMGNKLKAKTDIDHKNVEKGLVKLVLTLVNLIRKLMEKQAIRRIEDDQLNDREIEDLGNMFLLLEEKMSELKKKVWIKG